MYRSLWPLEMEDDPVVSQAYFVHRAFSPEGGGYLKLAVNDEVVVRYLGTKGEEMNWLYGYTSNGERRDGWFPLDCLLPDCPDLCHLTIACTFANLKYLQWALVTCLLAICCLEF